MSLRSLTTQDIKNVGTMHDAIVYNSAIGELGVEVREKILDYIRTHYPDDFPKIRLGAGTNCHLSKSFISLFLLILTIFINPTQ